VLVGVRLAVAGLLVRITNTLAGVDRLLGGIRIRTLGKIAGSLILLTGARCSLLLISTPVAAVLHRLDRVVPRLATGNEENDQLWGETVCITDGSLAASAANIAMPDNIAFQPARGNWIIHEDADTTFLKPHNNDLWDCLPDGMDEDLLSDGCLRIATLNDLTAEWTGGIFDSGGQRFWVSVQHNVTGKGIVLEVSGWDS
jgi:hypothetical protein